MDEVSSSAVTIQVQNLSFGDAETADKSSTKECHIRPARFPFQNANLGAITGSDLQGG
jgi:hypothetical protein